MRWVTSYRFLYCLLYFVCLFWARELNWAMASSFTRFLDHKQRCTTVCMTPLDGLSARGWDFLLTTPNTHNRQTSMPPVDFEPTTPAGERPQTYALDRAATWTGLRLYIGIYKSEVPDNRHYRTNNPCWFVHKRVYISDKKKHSYVSSLIEKTDV
jgi:hypothetical protein